MEILQSRFILRNDPIITRIGGEDLNPAWWSRFYEYKWALDAARIYFERRKEERRLCLDAGCGIEHPFKRELLQSFDKVVAIDEDPAIETVENDDSQLELYHSPLETFQYNEPFDCIFCVSVLEHLEPAHLNQSVGNFYSLLRPGGCLALTFDFPHVNLDAVKNALMKNGFKAFGWDVRRGPDTLNGLNSQYPNPARPDLNVFRAFTIKPDEKVR